VGKGTGAARTGAGDMSEHVIGHVIPAPRHSACLTADYWILLPAAGSSYIITVYLEVHTEYQKQKERIQT